MKYCIEFTLGVDMFFSGLDTNGFAVFGGLKEADLFESSLKAAETIRDCKLQDCRVVSHEFACGNTPGYFNNFSNEIPVFTADDVARCVRDYQTAADKTVAQFLGLLPEKK